MKTNLKFWSIAMLFLALTSWQAQAQKFYGEKITEKGAISAAKLNKEMKNKASMDVKLTGKIEQVCKKKGCWMTFDMGNNQKLMIKFKDYGFFVPKDADGKTAVVEGTVKKEVIDVATLRHYAEDAGKTKEEIEKITEPEEKFTFEAKGVIIK
ncbi:MAG: DUF4920 domain-containing protein [Microscillaceae bacterium]|jgi:hypothetical protein|nr:DUF4920 domain-containing protein [Microscillaceae bacterium]